MTRLFLTLFLSLSLHAATIYTPGTYEWTATFGGGQWASGLIAWDNDRYTVATTRQSGPFGFGGAIADATYSHRLTLAFTGAPTLVTLTRLVSFVPPGLGYLPYGHLYGGYWPDDIPRFIGCDEPWRLALAVDCHGCKPVVPPGPPTPTTPEVPEPATLAIVGMALVGGWAMRRAR